MEIKIVKPISLWCIKICIKAFFILVTLNAQSRTFQYINSTSGLYSDNAHQIISDEKGFIWISTRDGLTKYDGYNFKHFRNNVKDANSISNNDVSSIAVFQGTIWAGTWGGGLNKYLGSNKFEAFRSDPNDNTTLCSNRIQKLFVDSEANLWICSDKGLDKYNPANKKFKNILKGLHVFKIVEDKDKNFLILNAKGLIKYNPRTQEKITYPDFKEKGILEIFDLCIDESGDYWLGTENGLFKYIVEKKEISKFEEFDLKGLHEERIRSIVEHNKTLWIGTVGGGLFSINEEKKETIRYVNNPDVIGSLSSNFIFGLYLDKSENLWISTIDGGINKLNLKPPKFKLFKHEIDEPGSLIHNTVSSFFEDSKGNIWISTGAGLCKFDRKTQTFEAIKTDPGISQNPKIKVVKIFEAPDGTILLNIYNKGLAKYNPKTNKIEELEKKIQIPDYLFGQNFWGYYKTSNNEIIVGTSSQGIYKLDFEKNSYVPFLQFTGIEILLNKSIQSLFEDSNGVFWYGTTAHGLYRVDYKNEKINIFSSNSEQNLSSDFIVGISEDENYIWVCAYTGLDRIDKKKLTVEHIKENNESETKFIQSMIMDNQQNLWIASNKGLMKYNIKKNEFVNYNKGDGLQENIFNLGSALKTKDGELFFGGNNGFNSFYPESIISTKQSSPVFITELLVRNNGKDVFFDFDELKDIELTYKENNISIRFAVMDYTNPNSNRFKYKLENYDSDWISSFDINSANYSNLEPGEYTFRVIGSNSDQVWNKTGASLKIKIIPPFWQTAWFKVAAFFLTVFLIIAVYRIRVNSLEVYNKKLEKEVEERTKELDNSNKELMAAKEKAEVASKAKSTFLAHMSHELRTPLNGMMGYTQILKNKSKDKEFISNLNIIHQSGLHLLTLINDILDISKIEAGKMTLVNMPINFQSFLDNITGIIGSRAVSKGLTFKSDFDPLLPNMILSDETRLRQVLLNLLGNAVKFTDDGEIILKVAKIKDTSHDKQLVRFNIIDTGSGIEKDDLDKLFKPFEQVGDLSKRKEGTGLGLSISKHIVNLMGSDLQVQSTVGQGSNFWFEIELHIISSDLRLTKQSDKQIVGYEGSRKKILIADDISSNRNVIVKLLKPLDFKIIEAEDGTEAIDKVLKKKPDLILMDRWMPDINGIDALKSLREIPEIKDVPFIAVTVTMSDDDTETTLAAGFNDILFKPVIWQNLIEILQKHLNLTWIFEDEEAESILNPNFKSIIPLVQEELVVIKEYAKRGDIYAIQNYVKNYDKKDEKFTAFIEILQKLANNYEEKKILDFVSRYIENNN